jgi:SAM-dependent methyltransferase/FKBP-type peptidyl-prolyl cis-trans isomerase 2
MNHYNKNIVADIRFQMRWGGVEAIHTEEYEAFHVNFWRDCLPKGLYDKLGSKSVGQTVRVDFSPGAIVPKYDLKKTFEIKEMQFNRRFVPNKEIEPRMGRFYPKGLLNGVAGVFPQNLQPFRCVGIENGALKVDFNHPLARERIQVKAFVKGIRSKSVERGGRCNDWMEIMADGPGMQSRWEEQPTDFLSEDPFRREDDGTDLAFYKKPRLVQHIDDRAIEVVEGLYGRFVHDGMRVLDLMSSWKSHLPQGLRLKQLSGLGLNEKELAKNKDLSDWVVHDLNENPLLPYEAESYDAIVCTVSIEYLIDPETVFKEIGRILRPGGIFIVTFSNRWFPEKVIHIWKALHEFERMGLVMEYFQKSEMFTDLETYSIRGLPRPTDDKYFPEIMDSDPIYAVLGYRK